MNHTMKLVCLAVGSALLSVSAHAACGGGGFKQAPEPDHSEQVSKESKRQAERSAKLEKRQREIDKAQANLDRCQGPCDKERRKLEEAKAKYDKEANGG